MIITDNYYNLCSYIDTNYYNLYPYTATTTMTYIHALLQLL